MTNEAQNPNVEHAAAPAGDSSFVPRHSFVIRQFVLRHSAALFLLGSLSSLAEAPRPTLPADDRTNGRHTLTALDKLAPLTLACTASIESLLGRHVCSATIVGEDGYILTKASEVPDLAKARVKFADGRTTELREIQREVRYDLVLAQAVGISGLRAANFGSARPLTLGQWLCSGSGAKCDPRIGIISANRRRVPGLGAALGVRMDEKKPENARGVRIIGIANDSPAEAAGLRKDDVLLAIADQPVAEFKGVHDIVNKRQPGEVVEVRYLRKEKEETCRVRLASRTKILQNWEGEDFANGGISLRTDNFPDALQHDIPLVPADMGGPLATLDGKVVGINIARVDRVTTFALPVESFWTEIQQWIKADRHPPKAQPAE
ncbi:MAG: serine protease [Verrucomicrobiaceae bacterium]|nr:serine protease [Verrucomicrobiaceae bacterium]